MVDVIRGEVEFPHAAMEDFVVVKSNGQPLFVLANVVDDIDMAITHVIRGEDLLPTTPKGLLLWGALASSGWQTDGLVAGAPSPTLGLPVFAHLPLLVNAQRKKLSKRRDSVAVESYREQGYLPDAFVNYLALLGWGPPGGEELFGVDQLLHEFRLDHVNHSPAFFDVDKLKHMNGEYIRALSVDEFIEAAQPWLTGPEAPWPPENFDARTFARDGPPGPGAGGPVVRGAGDGRLLLRRRAGHRPRLVGQGVRRRGRRRRSWRRPLPPTRRWRRGRGRAGLPMPCTRRH